MQRPETVEVRPFSASKRFTAIMPQTRLSDHALRAASWRACRRSMRNLTRRIAACERMTDDGVAYRPWRGAAPWILRRPQCKRRSPKPCRFVPESFRANMRTGGAWRFCWKCARMMKRIRTAFWRCSLGRAGDEAGIMPSSSVHDSAAAMTCDARIDPAIP